MFVILNKFYLNAENIRKDLWIRYKYMQRILFYYYNNYVVTIYFKSNYHKILNNLHLVTYCITITTLFYF